MHEPVVPKKDGRPPAWIVRCAEGCTFAHDAHGSTEAEARASVTHAHALRAERVEYRAHPLYA